MRIGNGDGDANVGRVETVGGSLLTAAGSSTSLQSRGLDAGDASSVPICSREGKSTQRSGATRVSSHECKRQGVGSSDGGVSGPCPCLRACLCCSVSTNLC